MIVKYAQAFGMNPDKVLEQSHNGVLNVIIMWKEQEELQERLTEIMQEVANSTNKT